MSEILPFFPVGFSQAGPDLFSREPRLLSLDFDGTLAEIASTPEAARMTDDFRILLKGLSLLPRTKLVILSGRSVPDIKAKIRVPGIVFVGNHGLDFSPPSAGWGISALSEWTRKTVEVRERLSLLVKKWPGAFLEAKGPDLSLHYRLLKPELALQLIPEALGAIQDLPVVTREGKCVLEFKPKGAPGKGEALERLADRFFKANEEGLCLHMGDDQTDEEAFQALRNMGRRGLGVKVGPGPSRAHFRLSGPPEVYRFLKLFMSAEL